jgi:hypothetical protein
MNITIFANPSRKSFGNVALSLCKLSGMKPPKKANYMNQRPNCNVRPLIHVVKLFLTLDSNSPSYYKNNRIFYGYRSNIFE